MGNDSLGGAGEEVRPQFSSALRKELAIAFNAYMASRSAASEARLRVAADVVCVEAHSLNLSHKNMTLALRHLFAELPGGSAADEPIRREAFDRFLAGCIRSYSKP
jgi:hypothetical protein